MRTVARQLLAAACLATLLTSPAAGQKTAHQSPKVKGFGSAKQATKPHGFGEPATENVPASSPKTRDLEQARRYARSLLRRYDKNENGRLERNEWTRIRGAPAKSDANGDGVLTVEEIAIRVASRPTRSHASGTSTKSKTKGTANKSKEANPGPDQKRTSHRFIPAAERMPKGLPSWFKQRDKDQDGQVAMHEYARRWSDRSVRDFERYDKNGDGLITPAEASRR